MVKHATFVAALLLVVSVVVPISRAGAVGDVYRRWLSPKIATCETTGSGVRVTINNTDIEFNDLPQGAQWTLESVLNGATTPSGPFPVEQLTGTRPGTGVGQGFFSYPFTFLLRYNTLVGGQVVYRSTLDLSCTANGARAVSAINEVPPPPTPAPYRRWSSAKTVTCATTGSGVQVTINNLDVEFNNLPSGTQYTVNIAVNGATTVSGPYPVELQNGSKPYGGFVQAFPSYPFTYVWRIDTLVGGQVVHRSTLDLSCTANASRPASPVNEVPPPPPPTPYRRWSSPKTVTSATTGSGVQVSVSNLDVEFNNLPSGAQYTLDVAVNGTTTVSGPYPVELQNGSKPFVGFLQAFPSYPFTYIWRIDTVVGGQVVYRSTLDLSCTANGARTASAANEEPPPSTTADLVTVQPARLFDSRSTGGARGAGSVIAVQVTGRGGVPVSASMAALNITAVDAGAAGFMTVYPCGSAVPDASNLNYRAGQTIPNAAIVKLDALGRVCVFTSATSGLLVDVNGYTPATSDAVALNPFRLYDSRAGAGARPSGSITEIQVASAGGVPADAAAALLNVTAVDAQADGFMTVFPCGTAVPDASNLNYRAGQTIANAVLARIGTGGRVCVYTHGDAHLIIDVNAAVPTTSTITAVDPHRLEDTRLGATPAGAGTTTAVQVSGAGGVPAGAVTAVLNVTALEAGDAGFITVFPCGTTVPDASNLNYRAGQTIPNAVIAKLSPNGAVCLYTSAVAGLIVDVNGYAT